MKALDYDMKGFLRILFNTDVYQRKATVEDIEVPQEYAFTGPVLRRMSAEQIWDSLVTLINANPDLGNWRASHEAEIRNSLAEMMTNALMSKPEDQLMADVKRIANTQKDIQKKLVVLQEKQTEARKNKEMDKARELSREAGKLQNQIRDQVYETVYAPALKKVKAEVVSLEMPMGMGAMQMKLDPRLMDQ
jgi:hypothetical protein